MGLKDIKARKLKHIPATTMEIACKNEDGTFSVTGSHQIVSCADKRRERYDENYIRFLEKESRKYVRVDNEYIPLPLFVDEAGTLSICDRCANQLTCLGGKVGELLTPGDLGL